MSQGSEAQLIREFREILARDELAEDVTVVYGVSGGIPGQQPGDRDALGGEIGDLKLAGDGNLKAPGAPPVRLDPSETRQLLELVASLLDSMVPQGEARFLPDSAIGFVTIGVRRNETTLYFLADESQRFDPGSVMTIGVGGRIRPCTEAYDHRVVGVVSGAGGFRSGIVMDSRHGQRRTPVALSGKVCCRVDAGYAPVEAGDLLTTSATSGTR